MSGCRGVEVVLMGRGLCGRGASRLDLGVEVGYRNLGLCGREAVGSGHRGR